MCFKSRLRVLLVEHGFVMSVREFVFDLHVPLKYLF